MHYNTEECLANLRHNLEYLLNKKQLKMPKDAVHELLNQQRQLTVDELLLIGEMSNLEINMLLHRRLPLEKIAVKMLVMDCDGVLTDGGMTFSKDGDEIKKFNAKDGQGIKRAHNEGLLTGIISAGHSTGLVEKRAAMLGIEHVYVGKRPKLAVLEEWLTTLKFNLEDIAYIGDDISDIPILEKVALAACPSDAVKQVREISHLVLQLPGGAGCVRELIDEHLLTSSPRAGT
ncbi:MAG: HAD-IIIA family hydrolase [Owenweeksia sp.]|nr:HAD-IIIA family hydrolase [Owenweeksia sp.]